MRKVLVFIAICCFATRLLAVEITQDYILKTYEKKVDELISKIISDSTFYNRLGYLCDVFGHRFSGSQNLERAIDWLYTEMKKDALQNVEKDSVWVPHWVRGYENAKL